MNSLHVSEDIVSLSDFKNNASKMLRLVRSTHRPVVITQNGKAAGVLISPADFDQLTERARFVSAVEAGMSDAREGKLVSDEDLSGALDETLLDQQVVEKRREQPRRQGAQRVRGRDIPNR